MLVLQRLVKWEGFLIAQELFVEGWKRVTVYLRTPILCYRQHYQNFIEKSSVLRISWVCKSSAALGQIQEKQSTDAYRIFLLTAVIPSSISSSTVRPVQPWDVFLLFLKRNIFLFIGHVKQNPLCSIASNVFPKRIFIRFYSDIWRLSRYFDPLVRKNQYNRNFIDEKKLFHFNEILCFTQSSQLRNQEVAS